MSTSGADTFNMDHAVATLDANDLGAPVPLRGRLRLMVRLLACSLLSVLLVASCGSDAGLDRAEPTADELDNGLAIEEEIDATRETANKSDNGLEPEQDVDPALAASYVDDVVLTVAPSETVVAPGESATLTARVSGIFPDSDGAVLLPSLEMSVHLPSLEMIIPDGITLAELPQDCAAAGQTVSCAFEGFLSLDKPWNTETEPVVWQFSFAVENGAVGPLIFELAASSLENPVEGDPDPSNNTQTVTVQVANETEVVAPLRPEDLGVGFDLSSEWLTLPPPADWEQMYPQHSDLYFYAQHRDLGLELSIGRPLLNLEYEEGSWAVQDPNEVLSNEVLENGNVSIRYLDDNGAETHVFIVDRDPCHGFVQLAIEAVGAFDGAANAHIAQIGASLAVIDQPLHVNWDQPPPDGFETYSGLGGVTIDAPSSFEPYPEEGGCLTLFSEVGTAAHTLFVWYWLATDDERALWWFSQLPSDSGLSLVDDTTTSDGYRRIHLAQTGESELTYFIPDGNNIYTVIITGDRLENFELEPFDRAIATLRVIP